VRKDSPNPSASLDDPSTESGFTALRLRVTKLMPILVWGLVFGTSVAMASLSWWLVPPYLALMVVFLFEPVGRRVNATNPAGPESAVTGVNALANPPDPVVDGGSNNPDSSAVGDAPASSTTAAKARRGTKSRSKKARSVVEPVPAAWIQVAPGKFVRVEPGIPLAGIAPHPALPEGEALREPPAAREDALPRLDEPEQHEAASGFPDLPTEDAIEPAHLETSPRDLEVAASETRDDASDGKFHGLAEVLADRRPNDDDLSDPGSFADAFASEFHESDGDPPEESEAFDAEPAGESGDVASEPLTDVSEADAFDRESVSAEVMFSQGDEATENDAEADDGFVDQAEPGGHHGRVWDDDVRAESARPSPRAAFLMSRSLAIGLAPELEHDVPPSRWNVRSARRDRLPTGFRRRSPRGVGRLRHLLRAFPPRSPP